MLEMGAFYFFAGLALVSASFLLIEARTPIATSLAFSALGLAIAGVHTSSSVQPYRADTTLYLLLCSYARGKLLQIRELSNNWFHIIHSSTTRQHMSFPNIASAAWVWGRQPLQQGTSVTS